VRVMFFVISTVEYVNFGRVFLNAKMPLAKCLFWNVQSRSCYPCINLWIFKYINIKCMCKAETSKDVNFVQHVLGLTLNHWFWNPAHIS